MEPMTGRLLPLESKTIVASFLPTQVPELPSTCLHQRTAQLGRLAKTIDFVADNGIFRISLKMFGISQASTLKKPVIKGVDKVDTDFQPQV